MRGIRAVAVLIAALAVGCGGGRPSNNSPSPDAATATVYTRYTAADTIIFTACAGCHSRDGKHPDHERAYQVLPLDSYGDWRSQTTVIAAVLDTAHLDGRVMPPANAPVQLTDDERALLLDWTRRGAPDSPEGR